MDYLKYYDLENYLFRNVNVKFRNSGRLNAFDFFSIIIWKSNRAKSRIAKKIIKIANKPLEEGVEILTVSLYQATSNKEKLRILIADWKFLLPMSSAILTVLYPQEFTVYDVRVCGVLGKFQELANKTNFEKIWVEYNNYIKAVKDASPKELSLRDKDRWLWAKSFYEQLDLDIKNNFEKYNVITEQST